MEIANLSRVIRGVATADALGHQISTCLAHEEFALS